MEPLKAKLHNIQPGEEEPTISLSQKYPSHGSNPGNQGIPKQDVEGAMVRVTPP